MFSRKTHDMPLSFEAMTVHEAEYDEMQAEGAVLPAEEQVKLLAWLKRLANSDYTAAETGTSPLFDAVAAVQKQFIALSSELSYSSGCIDKSSLAMCEKSREMRDRALTASKEAAELQDLSDSMNFSMNTVASAAEELSINMKDIAEAAVENRQFASKIAESTATFSGSARAIAVKTEQALGVTVRAKKEAFETMTRVEGLETATREIGAVTEAIAEIAEQTKLLALNATIEAARAGTAGRGFAVVAKEVKDLAQQTNSATEDIREKISAIEKESRRTIEAISSIRSIIDEVAGVVDTISHSSQEQAETFRELQDMTAQNNIRIEQISDNVKMGASAVRDVTITISDVAKITGGVSSAIARLNSETASVTNGAAANYALALESSGQGQYVSDLLKKMNIPAEIHRLSDSARPELCRFSPAFSVEVEQFNSDHRRIFALINEIHQLVKSENSGPDLLRVMKELAQFCVGHFDREEIEMRRFGYSQYEQHKRIHEDLLAKVRAVLETAEKGEPLDLIAVLMFLKEWLYAHIQGVDKLYTPFMHEHNVF